MKTTMGGILITSTISLIGLIPMTIKTIRLHLKFKDVPVDFFKIAKTVLFTLHHLSEISTKIQESRIRYGRYYNGVIHCYLNHGTTYERAIFIDTLEELLAPINNPRYVIVRKSDSFTKKGKKDYHPIPKAFSKNKETLNFFCKKWEELVGEYELINCRTLEGRRKLLKSRVKALSTQFLKRTERINRWS